MLPRTESRGRWAWLSTIALLGMVCAPADRSPAISQGPRPIEGRGIDNLVAFARLLGYVRHFHPSDQAVATNWESFAIAGIDVVENARSPAELTARLNGLFLPVAPTLRLATRPLSPLKPEMLGGFGKRDLRITGETYRGWPPHGVSIRWSPYARRRFWAPAEAPTDSVLAPGSEINVELVRGVWCSVPLTLYADSRGTMPDVPPKHLAPRRPEDWLPTPRDRATRLADVMLFWNIARHFYPYFDVVGADWNAALPIALREAALDSSGASFESTLGRLVARLEDGHGYVSSPYARDYGFLPVSWRFVEGRLIVLAAEEGLEVHRGDEVTAIQGRPIQELVAAIRPTMSAPTPQWLELRVAEVLRHAETTTATPRLDTLSLTVRNTAAKEVVVRARRRTWGSWLKPPRPETISEVGPGVIYVDLDRVTEYDFKNALDRLSVAKGVIFDMRGYPNHVGMTPLSYLIDSTISSARWDVPVYRQPDQREVTFDFSSWGVEPQSPRIKGRVAFLIDGSAISAAETFLGMVEHYKLGELVGEPTAGTNGNVTGVKLPGNYDVMFTGMRVLKHGGSRLHGVGILPTVPVSPTVAGVRAGRDEQLEKAIEVVSG